MFKKKKEMYYIKVNTKGGDADMWTEFEVEGSRSEAMVSLISELAALYCPSGNHVEHWFDETFETNCGENRFTFKGKWNHYILASIESESDCKTSEKARKKSEVDMARRSTARDLKISQWLETNWPYTEGLIDSEAWIEFEENNTDDYGGACVYMAQRVMELLDECDEFDAKDLVSQADDFFDMGITGFMSGTIAQMVSLCHIRGDEFWYSWNGDDTAGVKNPALLTIEMSEHSDHTQEIEENNTSVSDESYL